MSRNQVGMSVWVGIFPCCHLQGVFNITRWSLWFVFKRLWCLSTCRTLYPMLYPCLLELPPKLITGRWTKTFCLRCWRSVSVRKEAARTVYSSFARKPKEQDTSNHRNKCYLTMLTTVQPPLNMKTCLQMLWLFSHGPNFCYQNSIALKIWQCLCFKSAAYEKPSLKNQPI